jgi:hypothetical protein
MIALARHLTGRVRKLTHAIKGIIVQLAQQRAAIDRALVALREIEGIEAPSPRRNLQATTEKVKSIVVAKKPAAKKGTLTPEGRRKLSEAMRRRWEAAKAEGPPNKPRSKRAAKKAA